MVIKDPQERAPYPDGTIVIYWTFGLDNVPVKTDIRGRVETITPDSQHAPWLKAPLGEKVIRIFDSNGRETSNYERFMVKEVQPQEPKRWFKEDETPAAAKESGSLSAKT